MSETILGRFQYVDGEKLLLKWEDQVRIDAPGAGLIRSKNLVGKKDHEIPAYIFITNKRLIILAEYTTQKRLRFALVISLPGGRKKSHSLYSDFSLAAFKEIKSGLFGGAKISFTPHGPLAKQEPRANAFVVHCKGLKKKIPARC